MPPLIRKPRYTPLWQYALVVGVGVLAGVYVWKPVFAQVVKDKKEKTE